MSKKSRKKDVASRSKLTKASSSTTAAAAAAAAAVDAADAVADPDDLAVE